MLCVFALLFFNILSSTQANNCSIAKNVRKNSTTVDLSNKGCTSCWSEPCNKTGNITELVLSSNALNTITPYMFTCLGKLKIMNLNNNKIKTIRLGAFSNLINLEQLNLKNNEITTSLLGAFSNLINLEQLDLGNNSITRVEEESFSKLISLTQLKLDSNGLAKIVPGAIDNLNLHNLQLDRNELQKIPVFREPNSIQRLEISENPIKKIDVETMEMYPMLEVLHLEKTKITKLPNLVFKNNSKLRDLLLKGSTLKEIEPRAFEGTQIISLNLEGTLISFLPGKDLENLENFFIKGVKTLWKIPIVNFKNLKHAAVEYPFHCCLIHSQLHHTENVGTQVPSLQSTHPTSKPCNNKSDDVKTTSTTPHPTTKKAAMVFPLPLDYCSPKNSTPVPPPLPTKSVNCTPKENAFNPCVDLLGSHGLRVCSWIVLVFAVLGNSFKLFVLLMSKRKISITRILMCNLAIANLCMGFFLCMLASADLYSMGQYQNFAVRWQYRVGCNVAGFVSIFSTELAVFVLTVITVERYFTIVHALKSDKHLNVKQIILLMVLGWIFSLTMATLPLLPYKISSYKEVAICLPFEVESTVSKVYVTFLLATNGLAFFFVLFCYGRMYCSLGGAGSRDSVHRVESRVAKRMAMLVITNFVCWFPIALVSLIAIYGTTLISVSTAKFFLVFVYPINSLTNPYLYAIGTKHFQLDALEIIGRLGICNSAIKNLSNKLRDQLEITMPNSSRGVTGSKLSLSSTRSPNQTPTMSSHENNHFSGIRGGSWKSNNGSTYSNNNGHQSRSSSRSTTCSPCNFLSIPSIHTKNYALRQQREEFDSIDSLSQRDSSTENIRPSLTSPDQLDKVYARRTSTREIFLEGNIFSWNKRRSQGGATDDSDETMPLEPDITRSAKTSTDQEEQNQEDSPILHIPTLMVTGC